MLLVACYLVSHQQSIKLTKTAILSQSQSSLITYLLFIVNVDISSLVNHVFQHVNTAIPGCHMQGSPLMEEKETKHHKSTFSLYSWL